MKVFCFRKWKEHPSLIFLKYLNSNWRKNNENQVKNMSCHRLTNQSELLMIKLVKLEVTFLIGIHSIPNKAEQLPAGSYNSYLQENEKYKEEKRRQKRYPKYNNLCIQTIQDADYILNHLYHRKTFCRQKISGYSSMKNDMIDIDILTTRSSQTLLFYEKGFLKYLAKFTGEHLSGISFL